MAKLYTRGGDQGRTSLADGTRTDKGAPRIEAVGALDELNSHIGLLMAEMCERATTKVSRVGAFCKTPVICAAAADDGCEGIAAPLRRAQHLLFAVGADVACANKIEDAPNGNDIKDLENAIDRLDAERGASFGGFVLPGGSVLAAQCHVCRTVCRRAERRVCAAGCRNPFALPYLNRLSDYLYALALWIETQSGSSCQSVFGKPKA
ncbi:MAG: ATP:cob(I)alamin adenosyltransferase [Alloprevotella sp.]|nr:ATP:cob(I)alamin adenosyltransferase [Alloprevotella sp.]